MSSILDALKRLESESPEPTPPGGAPPSWLAQSEVTAGWRDRLWETLITQNRRWITAAVTLTAIVAAAAAVWLAWHTLAPAAKPARPVPSASTLPRTVAPGPSLAATASPRPAKPVSPKPSVARTMVPGPPLSPDAPPVTAAVENVARPTADSDVGTPSSSDATSADTQRPGQGMPPSGDPAAAPMPIPADAGLTLQAISWSKEADKRIVVINDRVLHPGQAIAGYVVEAIDPNSVTLSQSGRVYGLAFRPDRR